MATMKRPEGYHSVTPYLIVNDGAQAITFYQAAFNAELNLRLDGPDDMVAHAEIRIGDSVVMLADEQPEMGALSPDTLGGAGMSLMVYVDNVDQFFQQAILAGATELRPVADQFYGDRAGTLKDPFGHVWTVATHMEALTEAQLKERMAQAFSE